MNADTIERFEQLESPLAHLERLCEQLNQVVVEQGKVLARLQSQQKQFAEALGEAELDRIRATNSKPPHYG